MFGFDEHEWKKRTHALVDLLCCCDCDHDKDDDNHDNQQNHHKNQNQMNDMYDVICLQEVTPRCLDLILSKAVIRQNYRVTDEGPPTYRTIGRYYGVSILVRRTLPVPDIHWVDLPTSMGRSGLIASFDIVDAVVNDDGRTHTGQQQQLAIATVHLESLDSQTIRAKQLKILHTALSRYSSAVLVGDYNITATGPYGNPSENQDLYSILDDYHDLWLEEYGIEGDDETSPNFFKCITFDSTNNTMFKAKKLKNGADLDHSRLDRVFVRCCSTRTTSTTDDDDDNDDQHNENQNNKHGGKSATMIHANNIRIIGDNPIIDGPDDDDLFISDHYGLAFEVTIMNPGEGSRQVILKTKKQPTTENDAANHHHHLWRKKNTCHQCPSQTPIQTPIQATTTTTTDYWYVLRRSR